MAGILFLHDTNLSLLRGAELTIKQLINLGEKRGFAVEYDLLRDFEMVKARILDAELVVINSTSRCRFEKELFSFIFERKIRYVKIEFDYNFCARRNIICTVDRKYRLCCDTDKFHIFRDVFANSLMNFFQSPKHYQSHLDFYGDAIGKHMIMPPTVEVDSLQVATEKIENIIPFFGELSFLKGGDAYVDYAIAHPELEFHVYGPNKLERQMPPNVRFLDMVSNDEVLQILRRSKYFICKPFWPEPSGRLAAEAFLSGCEIIANDRVGTFSFDWFPNDPQRAKDEIRQTPDRFWNAIEEILDDIYPKTGKESLGKMLVYKSYGGLGDIFFCIPSLYELAKVCDDLTFAVAPRLVSFFTKHLKGINVADETICRTIEDRFDNVIELGNYPAFRGYDLPHAMRYPTHKRVKQHAIRHYVDAVAKLHPDIDNSNTKFPYFHRSPNFEQPYYTMHPGAGFLLKIWPTQNYADVIRDIHKAYPQLRCKVIMGPDDPNPLAFFEDSPDYVDFVTGGMEDVGNAMSGALFHIGNDAGITHVAGAFNVPIVGIYGPTGPGSWGCFSEHNEIVWGKSGVCGLRCNYDVILNCSDRVCLTSTTSKKVMAALFKLLQKAYPGLSSSLVLNPNLQSDFTETDCLITIDKKEFLVNFADRKTKASVNAILSGSFEEFFSEELVEFTEFLRSQEVVLSIPDFDSVKT